MRPDRIAVGDCYDDPPTAEVERFRVVPCDQAHDNEVFHVFEATGADYPGEQRLLDDAAVRCRGDAFTDYVGVPLEGSDLRVFQVLPTAETWRRGDREVERFRVVPCDQAHDNEVFHVFEATGAEYPGEERLLDDAAVRCRGDAFTDFVGVPLEESELAVFQVLPTAETWRRGDREVVCVLYADGGGRIVGSARSDG